MFKNTSGSALSLLLVIMVCLNGVHIPQLLNAKEYEADAMVLELHNHSDKSGTQLIKDATNHQVLADNRSLRILHVHKRDLPYRYRIADWLRSWWQLTVNIG